MFGEKCIESSSITGSGSYSLGTAVGAFQSWRSQFATASVVFYCAENADGTSWEIGYGTLTYGSPDTLSRNLIASSTGSLISWAVADAPIYVMSAPVGASMRHGLTNGLGTSAPAWKPAGLNWLDYTLGLAVAWVDKIWNGAADMERGRAYIASGIYAASQRSLFVDIGAANYTFTANDIGKVLCFDTTAGVRTLTMLANNATGMGHGAYVFVKPYGSATNGVTFTPGGADTTDLATAPPGRVTKFIWDGAKSKWAADYVVPSGQGTTRQQTFIASGTYTPHADMVTCLIECVGSGGGGGGTANSGGANQVSGAGGGGAGSYSRKMATRADIGASQVVTIGAAGAGGAAGTNTGVAGADVSVGSLCIGKGGAGGVGTGSADGGLGGLGGVAGTGDVTGVGAPGGNGWGAITSGATTGLAGTGGSTMFGGGGRGAQTTATGGAATGRGAGGGGACSVSSGGAAAGGAGTVGIVIITEYCSK